MHKLLIISGPTATGKTSLGIELAKKYNGEIISADSRQVYTGMDIVTGKDLPPTTNYELSTINWRNKFIKYYVINNIKVWLYDVVNPEEDFNVSFWKECADMVINDIHSRNKLPIIVGGTGLYIKSITHKLDTASVPPNAELRKELSDKSVEYLFEKLMEINSNAANKLNLSDSKNPRRLIRAIELSITSNPPSLKLREGGMGGELFHISLTAPFDFLKNRIDVRVNDRIKAGAVEETEKLLEKYSPFLPSMSASGYRAFSQTDFINRWKILEHQYAKRQITWFKKQTDQNFFDISKPHTKDQIFDLVDNWYNNSNAKKS